jgi:hypothetical protein
VVASTAATLIAVGKTSFDDWLRLTSSFGYASRLRQRPAEQLRGAVNEHLVHVHVALRSRPGLPDRGELAVMLAGEYLVGGGGDRIGLLRIERAEARLTTLP